jgi:hypothetical protein
MLVCLEANMFDRPGSYSEKKGKRELILHEL